jgi:hypothetical protein
VHGALDPAAEVLAVAASRQKRRVHPLDINPTILHGFHAATTLVLVGFDVCLPNSRMQNQTPSVDLRSNPVSGLTLTTVGSS